MSWLFGKKKVPKVPFPQGHVVDENELHLPKSVRSSKVIQPDKIKEAVGVEKPFEFPELPEPSEEFTAPSTESKIKSANLLFKPRVRESLPLPKVSSPEIYLKEKSQPLYIKVNVYQEVLGRLEMLRKDLNQLAHAERDLENDEYNEEKNFEQLKREMRGIHDRLLQIDKSLFSPKGE